LTVALADIVVAPPLPAENRFALVIATSTHASSGYQDLEAPAQDAANMAAMLGDPEICGFEVQTLVDGSAAQIREAMNAFFIDRGQDDLVVFYFSGHGDKDDRGRLHFVAADTDPDTLLGSGVSSRLLLDLSDLCEAGRQVLILDCCFSGAFDAKGPGLADLLSLETRQDDQMSLGRCVLTASRGAQRSFQRRLPSGEVEGSVFTTALIEGIRSGQADLGHTGRITVRDAYRYAFAIVVRDRPRQNPQYNIRGAEGADILLARNPAGVKVGPGLYEVLAKVDSPHPNQRIDAVYALGQLLNDDNPAKSVAARRRLETLAGTAGNDLTSLAQRLLGDRDRATDPGWRTVRQRPGGEPSAGSTRPGTRPPPQPRRPRPHRRKSQPVDEPVTVDRTADPPDDEAPDIPPDEEMGLFLPDDEEFAGLRSVEDPLGVFDRRLTLEQEPTNRVARYLFPTEKFRGEWRRHWVDPLAAAALSGLAAGRAMLPASAPPLLPPRLWLVSTADAARWCLVAIAVLAGLRVLSWPFWRMSLSHKQIMLVRGVVWRRTWAVPLDRITDAGLSQSPLAQVLNYGTLSFRVGRWRLHRIRHIPFPNELWLRFVEERFEPGAVEARLATVPLDEYDV
jgi:hypothetical protein